MLGTIFAQGTTGGDTTVGLALPSNFSGLEFTFGALVGFLINAILILAGIIFFFMLIIGGLRWILSGGDKAKTEGARGQITAALVGLVIVFSAWAITVLISTIFGVDLGSLDFGTIGGTGAGGY